MAEVQEKSIGFRIAKIISLSFFIEDEPEHNNRIDTLFSFTVTVAHALHGEAKGVQVFVEAKVFRPDAPDNILSKLQVAFIYQVEGYDEYKWLTNEDIPALFASALHTMSISSTRGIFYAYVKGSYLENAIVPIIDVSQLQHIVSPFVLHK